VTGGRGDYLELELYCVKLFILFYHLYKRGELPYRSHCHLVKCAAAATFLLFLKARCKKLQVETHVKYYDDLKYEERAEVFPQ